MRPSVISFCDLTGAAVKPWADAGYPCYLVDVQHARGAHRGDDGITRIGASMFELHAYHRWMPQGAVAQVFAWPVCTDMAFSGQRWRRENGPTATAEGFRLFAACWDVCRFYERERGAAWMLENPRGLPMSWCKPDHVFHPWMYGDNESKETHIWCGGGFAMPAPTVLVKPAECRQSTWLCPPGHERGNIRSATPIGFSGAVFEANEPRVRERAA